MTNPVQPVSEPTLHRAVVEELDRLMGEDDPEVAKRFMDYHRLKESDPEKAYKMNCEMRATKDAFELIRDFNSLGMFRHDQQVFAALKTTILHRLAFVEKQPENWLSDRDN